MELDRRYAAVGIVILFLVFGGVGILNLPTDAPQLNKNVNDYGTIELRVGGQTIPSLDTILASGGIEVVWTATVSTSSIDGWMYTAAGINIEKGVHTQNSNIHTFAFNLDGAPQGTTELHVGFGGQYTSDVNWVGSSPHFFVEQDATPSFPAPEFTTVPDDADMFTGESLRLQWWFIYSGPAIARITVDGVTKVSKATTQTTSEQPLSYSASFAEAGIHKVKFIIEPDYDIPYASEVTLTVLVSTNTTTTTITTTTTAPTTTPPTGTTTPPTTLLPEDPIFTIATGALFAVVVIIIIYIQMRGRKD